MSRSTRSALGGDLVIVRSDGTPLYHFTVVVDDAAMAITHIIRGEDHLSNTPKHILLFEALGAELPMFAHLPLILNADRTKMSKRKSQTAIDDYRGRASSSEALVNYLALLGWSSGSEEEVFGLDELVERFDLERVHSGGAVFDRERLEWLNGQWIRRLSDDDLVEPDAAVPGRRPRGRRERGEPFASRPRTTCARSCPSCASGCRCSPRSGRWSTSCSSRSSRSIRRCSFQSAGTSPRRSTGLTEARRLIAEAGDVSFEADELEAPLRALAEESGWKAGDLFMAIRVAVTGRTATPPLFDTLVWLGPVTHTAAARRGQGAAGGDGAHCP